MKGVYIIIGKIRHSIQILGIIAALLGIIKGYSIFKIIFLGINFLMGPIFCAWVCPFGTLQDLFGILGDKLGIKKYVFPKRVRQILVYSRYVLLLVTIVISADFIFSILSLDPRSNLLLFLSGNVFPIVGWIIIVIFLLISLFLRRAFCNYLCIEGAKYGLVGIVRPITITRNKNTCINCKKCNKACPMNIDIVSYEQVRSLQCINCMECLEACPINNTLSISIIPVKRKYKKVGWSLIMLGILLVTFILYNNVNYSFQQNIGLTDKSTAIVRENIGKGGDASGIDDGVYKGVGKGFRGDMSLELTIKNEQITKIEVTETVDDAKWFEKAYNTIIPEIISSQTVNVDTVSGATYSSMGIKEAVANALINAGGKNVKAVFNDLPETD